MDTSKILNLKPPHYCDEIKSNIITVSIFLDNPKDLKKHEQVILKKWFSMLTCSACQYKVPSSFSKEVFPEVGMHKSNKDLWKIPFYLLNKDYPLYHSYYKTKFGEDILEKNKKLVGDEDIKEMDKALKTNEHIQFWTKVILNQWTISDL